ncbi:MAG: metallophosphoesterase [Acidobacteriia bacterium]|nr:metallophosphoesterase [Terriglobia bacterium]
MVHHISESGAAMRQALTRISRKRRKLISYFAYVLVLALSAAPALGQSWSFSVVGDARSGTQDFKAALNQIRDANDPINKESNNLEFILVAGDFDPNDINYAIYRSIFSGTHYPRFLPVIGNHDAGFRRFINETILPKEGIQAQFAKSAVSYYMDIRNVRMIVVDQYQGTGERGGCINDAGIRWVEETINSAKEMDHIFVAMHVPAFCRVRHVGEGFEACPDLRNRFWDMIVRHRDKVRAVLAAHTHNYSVMRVRDPRGPASDGKSYPFEPDGVYQFDAGGAGNSDDGKITVITFRIDGSSASAQVVQSPNGKAQFAVVKNVDLLAR